MTSPFSEASNFELGAAAAYDSQGNLIREGDPFYLTGSSPGIGDERSFVSPLANKAQIRLSYPVVNKISMLGNSSSIYYFNTARSQWNIPPNAVVDHTGPFDKYSSRRYDGYLLGVTNVGSRFIEDAIGFDAYGFCVASGTLNVVRNLQPTPVSGLSGSQTSENFAASFEPRLQMDFMTGDYPKNVQRNPDYEASDEETFVLPIDQPFLIEKAVFEIPVALGRSWFNDKTVTVVSGSSGKDDTLQVAGDDSWPPNQWTRVQDEGGPGITVSLMCQKNFGTSSIRDLVSKSLITHSNDTLVEIKLDQGVSGSGLGTGIYAGSYDNRKEYQYRSHQLGMPKTIPVDLVVTSPPSKQFTGSIVVKSTASATNGVKLYYSNDVQSDAHSTKTSAIADCLSKVKVFLGRQFIDTLSEGGSTAGTRQVINIDTFGRGFTGFMPSGGSIFGREFGAIDFNSKFLNPFYVSNSDDRDSLISDWSSTFDQNKIESFDGTNYRAGIRFNTAIILSGTQQSPYMVKPGEKLILAISKKRPALKSYKLNITNTSTGLVQLKSSSYYNDGIDFSGHDVTLSTGSINITLYGSYVQQNKEYIP